MDNRGVTPVVEKVLTMGLVVLFVGGTTTAMFGGVVPDYRDAVGQEVGDRVLTTASEGVVAAVPPNGSDVDATSRVDLPSSIRGTTYRLRTDGRTLVLEHPRRGIGGRVTLALPGYVASIDGRWHSGDALVVHVESGPNGLVVELREGAS